jgi:shikimate kinase
MPDPMTVQPHPGPVQRIVLTGFMGAGKSTVGRILARILDQDLVWEFLDIDDQIESAQGLTIAELFRAHGEPHFRELEHQSIRQLAARQNLVLGLGGGAIEDERTRALLLSTEGTYLIHLHATFDTVVNRCLGTETTRPLLADRPNLESRYNRRLPLYNLAHHTIPVDDLTPEAVAQAIRHHLGLDSH